jgi:acetyl esterase/lipase
VTSAQSFSLAGLFPFLVISGLVVPDAPPAGATRPAVTVERNVVYTSAGGQKLMLDIAMPAEPGPHPCVVCFHGGAWRMGSRTDLSRPDRDASGSITPSVIERLAANGYVAATVSYRLAPRHKFPAQIEDAKTAVRFLRANARRFGIDSDRFAAMGFSAGGHLSLLLGMADRSAGLEGTDYPDQSSRVQCVVDYFGPADLSLYAATSGLEDIYMVPFLGKECKTDPEVYRRASPMSYVSKDAPPILILHGTADIVVPIIHSERLQKKLAEAGAAVELVTVRGEGHGWNGKAATRTNQDTLKFLDTHLKGKK